MVHGRGRGERVRLTAVSNAAWFRRRSGFVTSLENAMEEALDQQASVLWPVAPPAEGRIAVAHRDHAAGAGMAHVASAVMTNRSVPVGILTLERREAPAFDAHALASAEAIAALLGPLLDHKRRARRWVSGRLADAIGTGARVLLGRRRPSIKLAVLAVAGAIAFVSVWPTDLRISGEAVLEGTVQRAAVAPFEGYIAAAPVRAGDVVEAGSLLARIDDADLRLEEARLRGEAAQLSQQQRDALAAYDRAEAARLSAQLAQVEAERDLIRARLARSDIRAPIAGLVVSGDLSQHLGSPVERGDTLFEIAPMDAFRVALAVPERDIARISAGDPGVLALSAMPGTRLPFEVTRIASVAEPADGGPRFRVEARLDAAEPGLRPGLEGVGKVTVGEAPLIVVWTRTLVHWLRHAWWEWTP